MSFLRFSRMSRTTALALAAVAAFGTGEAALAAPSGLKFGAGGVGSSEGSRGSLRSVHTPWGDGVDLNYEIIEGGWVNVATPLRGAASPAEPVTFVFHVDHACRLELKFVYADGATFGCRAAVAPEGDHWRRLTIYPRNAEYWWGGSGKRRQLRSFELAVTGTAGTGTVSIARMERGPRGTRSSFGPSDNGSPAADSATSDAPLLHVPYDGPVLDPDRNLQGYGTRQRRAETMIAEDPLVLKWLRAVQDAGSLERQLLPSTLKSDEAQTFNNALVAMAFIRHGERERAERILNFFQRAARKRDNNDPTLQSFYLRGEARGFYQRVSMRGENGAVAYHAGPEVDRWMGDMAWLWLAYRDYQQTYHDDRYADVAGALLELLKSWYIDNPVGQGGYVQHGWRRGDSQLHESYGHHEGNIDCYAVFSLSGERDLAEKIRIWLEDQLAGRNDLPLDLYAWRVLAYGGAHAELLNVPDFDLRYRKSFELRGREITGPYHGPGPGIDNIWFDGLGHLSCAYSAAGNLPRANFYSNQLDTAIIDQRIGGKISHAIPYTAKSEGDYRWVNIDEGFISVPAWYVFTKHRFNPLLVETAATVREDRSQ